MKKHLLFTFILLTGCATNPVTGKSELMLVSEQQELSIGAQQYSPARQSQGGDYIVDKKLTAYINQVGQKLAAVSDRKLPYEFKVLNNSIPNAWALPGGKISINRGLLTELHSEAELAAVLGHEIVHAAAKHGARQISKGMLLQTAVVATAISTQDSKYGGLAQLGSGIGAQLLSQKFGRDAERESDYYGMHYMARAGYNPQGAVDLQRTFVKMSKGHKQDWLNGLFASHPASEERVQNNIKLLNVLPKTGIIEAARYQKKISHLLKTKPAYDAYDKGREALAKGKTGIAKSLALKAIALEPKEALFYSLSGDVAQKRNQFKTARQQYDKAIALNPHFFYFYLQRGQSNYQLGLTNQAESDLKKSIQFLPTNNAYFTLGNIAKKAGRMSDAKQYFSKVANTKSETGKAAYASLLQIDLGNSPNTYLHVRTGKDNMGRILAEIQNPTPKNVGGLQVIIQFKDISGRQQVVKRKLRGSIAAGKKKVFDLKLPGQWSKEQLRTLTVKLSYAQVVR